MKLYEDKQKFIEAVNATSAALGIQQAIVEKDYFVTLILKKLKEKVPGIMFKGGTCLSKCFKVIERFSEDIDLTLDVSHFTQKYKRGANHSVIELCDELGFELLNQEKVEKHSHGDHNCYEISYPKNFDNPGLIPYIKLELVFIQKAYPDTVKPICSMIGETLTTQENLLAMGELGLEPFEIKVQSLERTFVDKVFAICDYFLRGESTRQSRHIYDIHQLMARIDWRDLKKLVDDVREDRMPNKTCLSAQPGSSVSMIIQKIIDTDYFRGDYEKITGSLIHKGKSVKYEDALASLKEIADSGIFELTDEGKK